jgi:hypothetical protein
MFNSSYSLSFLISAADVLLLQPGRKGYLYPLNFQENFSIYFIHFQGMNV